MAKKPNRQAEPLAGAYVLKRGKISDWAPNHPFAHEQISLIPKPALTAEEQKKVTDLWETKIKELDATLRASGRTVPERTQMLRLEQLNGDFGGLRKTHQET